MMLDNSVFDGACAMMNDVVIDSGACAMMNDDDECMYYTCAHDKNTSNHI